VRRLTRLAVYLYPTAWRERYGDEFLAMLEQGDAGLPVLLDVIAHGVMVRFRRRRDQNGYGGNPMLSSAKPQRLALLGLMVMLPTSALVVAAILKYIIGFDGPFDAMEPALTPIVTHPLGETLIVLAPYVALLLAVVPVTRLGLGWRTGRLSATMEVNAPALNIVVAVASVMLAAFMVLYWVAENL
jgi:hypothetical protein